MVKRKTKKQLAREAAQYDAAVRKAYKAANRQTEETLLNEAPVMRFVGKLIIQPRETAVSAAIELSTKLDDHAILYVDGAVHRIPEDIPNVSGHRQFKLGAAVAHQILQGKKEAEWSVTSFLVPRENRRNPPWLQAEMGAIAGALGMALSCIADRGKQGIPGPLKNVIILTDCQAAICELQKLQSWSRTKEQIPGYFLGRKLITRSQYLRRLGVTLEIHWLPRCHKDLPGSSLAHSGARQVARGTAAKRAVSERETFQIKLPPLLDNFLTVRSDCAEQESGQSGLAGLNKGET